MGTKATGADIKAFFDEWPRGDNWYHDDFAVDTHDWTSGEWLLDLATKYDLDDLGTINWQGPADVEPGDEKCLSFASEFKRWKKAQTHQTLVVTVPKDKADELRAYCKVQGWKVE